MLADIAALLLVLGLTGPLLAPVLRISFFDRLRVLAHPLVALAAVGAEPLRLAPARALRGAPCATSGVHALQHLLFVALGANMWMCLFGPLPKPAWFGNVARLVYILAVRLTGAVLANVFLFGGRVLRRLRDGRGALAHQPRRRPERGRRDHDGRGVDPHDLPVRLAVHQVAREGEERQELLELAQAAATSSTEQRAARAVAAGRGGDLRARIEEPGRPRGRARCGAPRAAGDLAGRARAARRPARR